MQQSSEVNFWQPGGTHLFKALQPGELFLGEKRGHSDFSISMLYAAPGATFELVGRFGNRDKASLDIFWLKDESLKESGNLPEPDVLAQEIADDLEAALEQFRAIATDLRGLEAEPEKS